MTEQEQAGTQTDERDDTRDTGPMPSVGRIVHYHLFKDEADKTNARRADATKNVNKMREERPGFQAHVGNSVYEGEVVPMIITKAWSADCVNGQVLLDGNDSLWVTSASKGDQPGQWQWPPRL